jgi:predicted solute-binding protein
MEKMPVTTGDSILLTKNQESMPPKVTYLGKEWKKPKSINIIYAFLATPNRKNLTFNHQRTEVPT